MGRSKALDILHVCRAAPLFLCVQQQKPNETHETDLVRLISQAHMV